ncbi:MAG: hypothetical protein QXK74_08415 [Candidatus Nitrosocaldaceae archaeon]
MACKDVCKYMKEVSKCGKVSTHAYCSTCEFWVLKQLVQDTFCRCCGMRLKYRYRNIPVRQRKMKLYSMQNMEV